MYKFERFIIYPLLIVSLFFSLSGKQPAITSAENVIEELKVKEISVVNEAGNKIISIGERMMTPFGEDTKNEKIPMGEGIIAFYNSKGEKRIEIATSGAGSFLQFFYGNRKRGIRIESLDKVGAQLYLSEKNSKNIVRMKSANGIPKISINNEYGNDIVNIGPTVDQHGGVWIFDRYGENKRSYGHREY